MAGLRFKAFDARQRMVDFINAALGK